MYNCDPIFASKCVENVFRDVFSNRNGSKIIGFLYHFSILYGHNININTKRNATIAEHHWFLFVFFTFYSTSPQRKFLSSPYHLYFFISSHGVLGDYQNHLKYGIEHFEHVPHIWTWQIFDHWFDHNQMLIRFWCAVKFRYCI